MPRNLRTHIVCVSRRFVVRSRQFQMSSALALRRFRSARFHRTWSDPSSACKGWEIPLRSHENVASTFSHRNRIAIRGMRPLGSSVPREESWTGDLDRLFVRRYVVVRHFILAMQRFSAMIPLPEAQSHRTMPETAPGSDSAEAALTRLRPLIRPGHVFAVDDDITGRTSAGKRNRPNVLVIVSPLHDRAALALQQNVGVSARLSWKEEWGVPGSPAAGAFLARRKWVFSPRYSLKAFNKDGIFELNERRTVRIAHLVDCRSLGWLPQPTIDAILAYAGARLPEPYPPAER